MRLLNNSVAPHGLAELPFLGALGLILGPFPSRHSIQNTTELVLSEPPRWGKSSSPPRWAYTYRIAKLSGGRYCYEKSVNYFVLYLPPSDACFVEGYPAEHAKWVNFIPAAGLTIPVGVSSRLS